MSRSTFQCATIEALDSRRLLSTVYALTEANLLGKSELIRFNAGNPGNITQRVKITGTQHGEQLKGIDFRPATGELYLLGITPRLRKVGPHDFDVEHTTRIYKLNKATGAATQVGSGFADPELKGLSAGLDFNPTVDRIRFVNNANQNQRIHPDTGAPIDFDPVTAGIQSDLPLAYAAADPNFGKDPNVTAVAYTNNDIDPATGTTLYGIDTHLNTLVTHNPPNNGTLNTVGALGVNARLLAGFDIETKGTANTAYAALKPNPFGIGGSKFYSINLATGAANLIGKIGKGESVTGIAIKLNAPPKVAAAPASLFADKRVGSDDSDIL